MEMGEFILIAFVISMVSGIIASSMANAKGYKSSMGALYGLFFGLFGIIIVGLYPNKKDNTIFEKTNINKYDELAKIQKLKDSDVLTEDEFISEKNKIMNDSKFNEKNQNTSINIEYIEGLKIENNKFICPKCNSKNSLKRTSCYMCATKFIK